MRVSLEAKPRSQLSKGDIKQLRRDGYTPVSVSEQGEETRHYAVSTRKLVDILRRGGGSAVFELTPDGEKLGSLVLPRDVQRNPISGQLLQVGLQRISARKPITAPVRVVLVGEPEAARSGQAVLEQDASTVELRALPDKLPSHINIDTANMEIGDVLHVSDFPASEDYEIVSAPDHIVCVLHTVRVAALPEEEKAEEVEGEAAAEEKPGAGEATEESAG